MTPILKYRNLVKEVINTGEKTEIHPKLSSTRSFSVF